MTLNFLYDLTYLPVSWQVGAGILTAIILIKIGAPMILFSLITLGVMSLYMVDPSIIIGVGIGLSIVSIPLIREQTVSRFILKATQVFKIFPKVSDTERAALEAGSVWMDRELFSGRPNINTLMNQDIAGLRPDEQAFIDGPVTELCNMVDDWEIQKTKQIPERIWTFIKDNKFLGMIIPKVYGGLELSAIGHSCVIEKITALLCK